MPRPGPPRAAVAVRMDRAQIAAIDRQALQDRILDERGLPNRSEMIRMLCHEALQARAAQQRDQ